ncbi:hypothetical protein L596_020432 [Steinernema carpocapsae]|uniref:Secreted protein n=1 Tax=Steinernema carpocapsae TaxID=34508 RepID=A0A4U5MTI5_STECR|nr:hypothetical protein L596_020432 [Steinernema carpocapsae]
MLRTRLWGTLTLCLEFGLRSTIVDITYHNIDLSSMTGTVFMLGFNKNRSLRMVNAMQKKMFKCIGKCGFKCAAFVPQCYFRVQN